MSIITRMLKQTAVYWPKSDASGGEDFDEFGQPVPGTPVEVRCRWDEDAVEFLSPQGTKEISRAQVFVGQDVEIGGVLMLGTLLDVTDAVNIKENDGAWEIRGFSKTPNLKATEFVRIAML